MFLANLFEPASLLVWALTDEERGFKFGTGIGTLFGFVLLIWFLLRPIRRRDSSDSVGKWNSGLPVAEPGHSRGIAKKPRRKRQERARFYDEDVRPRRRQSVQSSPILNLAVVGGVIGAALVVVGLVLLLSFRAAKPRAAGPQPPQVTQAPPTQPPGADQPAAEPAPEAALPAVPVPPPPPGMEKMKRVWILLNVQGDKTIEDLSFSGPPADARFRRYEVRNVRATQGPAPPAGTYYNHQFRMKFARSAGESGGIAVPSLGPYASAPLPFACRLAHLRKLGACTLDFPVLGRTQRLSFGVFEGFYE